MIKNRPAFVTGASGFIGRHLVKTLLSNNRKVYALCRNRLDLEGIDHPSLEVILGSLEDINHIKPFLTKEISVFHLAATRNTIGLPPYEYQRINQHATLELGRVAIQVDVAKFIHVSSAIIFGPTNGEIHEENQFRKSQHIHSSYIETKAKAHDQMLELVDKGLRIIVVCPTMVYGPDHPSHPNRITQQIRRLLRFKIDFVIGSGKHRRNIVCVEDVVRGILSAEECDHIGEVFILGGQDISHKDFNSAVFSLSNLGPWLSLSLPIKIAQKTAQFVDNINRYPPGSGYYVVLQTLINEWRFSSKKAEKLLDYHAMPIEKGLLKTISWIRSVG